jgi:hypothetical protein
VNRPLRGLSNLVKTQRLFDLIRVGETVRILPVIERTWWYWQRPALIAMLHLAVSKDKS